jgi:hypothetical protein
VNLTCDGDGLASGFSSMLWAAVAAVAGRKMEYWTNLAGLACCLLNRWMQIRFFILARNKFISYNYFTRYITEKFESKSSIRQKSLILYA